MMRIWDLVAVLVLFTFAAEAGRNDPYAGYTVYSVQLQDRSDLRILFELATDLDLDFWRIGVPGQRNAIVMVSPENKREFIRILNFQRIQYGVYYENVTDTLNKYDEDMELWRRTKKGRMFPFQDYSRYAEINAYLDRIANEYPDLVTLVNAGQSFEGRDVKYLKTNDLESFKPWKEAASS